MMQQHFSQAPQPQGDTLELAPEPSALDNGIAGFKKAFTDIGQGLGQVAGTVSREDVARTRAQDAELMDTTSGKVGNVLGNVAAVLPAAFIPGVNGVVGGMTLGGLLGAAQPSVSDSETAANVGFGVAGGGIGAKISQFLANRAAARAARSAALKPSIDAKNAALKEFHEKGLAVPPQDAGGGSGSQILNAIAGKIKTEQKSSVQNQPAINSMAAKSIGLPEHEPITVDAIDGVRKQAGKAYDAVRSAGMIKTDKQFQTDLSGIVQKFQSAAKDFPELLNNDVANIVKSVNKKQFDADSAVDAIKILRDKGTAAYRSGDADIAAAAKKSADALETAIERHLTKTGASPDLVKNFRGARELYAKTFSVEKALNRSTGNIKAAKLGAELDKGRPLTGDLKTIAEFSKAYPRSAQELQGVNPYSVLDAAGAVGGMAVNPAITAYVAGRPIARSMVLNPTYQKMFVKGSAPSNNLTNMLRLGSKTATPLSALAAMKSQEDK